MSGYRYPEGVLAVMAKAPLPGQVKTRLIPLLGAKGAAGLQARLLRAIVEPLLAARLCPVRLWCAPDPDHPAFAELAAAGAELRRQSGADLGERMANAAREALDSARFVILIGTDCPELDPAYAEAAMLALAEGCDAVLGPAEDGGYGLLGLSRFEPALFRDMPWSTAAVLDETRRRLVQQGLSRRELPHLWDLDRPEDVSRLAVVNSALLQPFASVSGSG